MEIISAALGFNESNRRVSLWNLTIVRYLFKFDLNRFKKNKIIKIDTNINFLIIKKYKIKIFLHYYYQLIIILWKR